VSTLSVDQEFFHPSKGCDHTRNGVLLMCDRWLVRPSFLPQPGNPAVVGLMDVATPAVRPPSSRVGGKRLSISIVRLAAHDRRTVQLSRSPDPARSLFQRSPRGLTVVRRSRTSDSAGRLTGRSTKVHHSVS
jgi:hypothetical protein